MNLKNIHRIYFIGIGGIGMSALARYFHANSKEVAGYDRVHSGNTLALEELGIPICFDEKVAAIATEFKNDRKTLVVYTPAVPQEHPQLCFFIKEKFKVLKRSEVLGIITKNTFCFAVAGTHGKTTTSTILGHILAEAGLNATSFLGGIAENYQSNLILGGDELSVVEADEFDRSFLRLSPNYACITSMDADHLDIYGQADKLHQSFKDFAAKVSDRLFIKKGLPLEGITYGIDEQADYDARDLEIVDGSYVFDIVTPTERLENIQLNLSGKHNVLNTVVALAMAHSYGVSLVSIAKALKTFKGVQRRFTYQIKTSGLVLIDDYAHHPTEIEAVASSVRELYPNKKTLAVFQPHLFSRTQDFVNEFADSLSKFDSLLLLDIYPARELPIEGVTSSWLLEKVRIADKKLVQKQELSAEILSNDAPVIVMMGAGDISELVQPITNELLKKIA